MLKQLLPSSDGAFAPRMNWKHWLYLLVLISTITTLALIRLGYGASHVPQTSWQPSSVGEFIASISRMAKDNGWYLGLATHIAIEFAIFKMVYSN